MVVEIEQIFHHCSKAFLRSELWDPESWGTVDLPKRAVIARDARAAGGRPAGAGALLRPVLRRGPLPPGLTPRLRGSPRARTPRRPGAGDDLLDRATTAATCAAAAPVKDAWSAISASSSAAAEAEPFVGGQPVQQVVALGALLAHRQRHRDGVLLDGLVRGLAADARATAAISTLVVARNGR